jgi:hypothetical protein
LFAWNYVILTTLSALDVEGAACCHDVVVWSRCAGEVEALAALALVVREPLSGGVEPEAGGGGPEGGGVGWEQWVDTAVDMAVSWTSLGSSSITQLHVELQV